MEHRTRIVCICGNCKNALIIIMSDENAELIISEGDENSGHRASIIVPLDLGIEIERLVENYRK